MNPEAGESEVGMIVRCRGFPASGRQAFIGVMLSGLLALVFSITPGLAQPAHAPEPTEPFLRDLPPGIFLMDSVEASAAQANAVGNKLGGEIERLTNTMLRVQGRRIQINAITAVDEENAKVLVDALGEMKPFPFCFRNGRIVIEYAGKNIDEALARKTSYELGLQPRPDHVRYRVVAELATVDSMDYMVCTPLFQQFLAARGEDGRQSEESIRELAEQCRFGHGLTMRNPAAYRWSAGHRFEPAPSASSEADGGIVYSFDSPPTLLGVPYVTATIEVTVDDTGFHETAEVPSKSLTEATPFWPSDDSALMELAHEITEGKSTRDDKVAAILAWLQPGRNLTYSGRTGSRWGTKKVFEQGFGHCWDFADCFVTLARACGVPTRQMAGWLYGGSGHVWAEYYREGEGWQQVDPSGGGTLKCGIYHIAYFTTEDGVMPILYVGMPKIEVVDSEQRGG